MTSLVVLAIGFIVQSGPPLSIEDAVRIALANSPKMQAARFEAQATKAGLEKERPVARPQVGIEAQGRVQGPRITFPRAGDGDSTVMPEQYADARVTIDQPLFRVASGAARERYGAQIRAAGWEEARAENDLILSVRTAYVDALAAREQQHVAVAGVDLARKHLDLVKLMLQAGTASERDVRSADADLAEAEQGQSKAANGVTLALANLNRLMGRDPVSTLDIAAAGNQPAIPDRPDYDAAIRRRPEIRQLEENLAAARAGVMLAATQDKPKLSGRAIAAVQTPSAFVKTDYLAGGLVLQWNPFDGWKSRADTDQAKAQAKRLEALLTDARLGIKLDAEKAWRDMKEASDRITTSERQVKSAEAALEISELRYQAGTATQVEVSAALFDVTKARSSRTQATYDLHRAAADYAHATGQDVPERLK